MIGNNDWIGPNPYRPVPDGVRADRLEFVAGDTVLARTR